MRRCSRTSTLPTCAALILGLLLPACAGSTAEPEDEDQAPDVTRTIGLMLAKSGASPGYTLMPPKHYGTTYLLDLQGRAVRSWKSAYPPGQSAYQLPYG
ncbi:MAG: hypothetical protein FIB01_05955, partial [Gemmatimonadetes bacterium]|nr:hypothetical protein [Gemmatimonadota bacterium]